MRILWKQSPGRIIALGFATVIILGSLILMLPISIKDGVDLAYIDALYTATSAVCVTGLVAVDLFDTFTLFGQIVVALLIQIGGLGVATLGAGIILAMGRRIGLKGRRLVLESLNLFSADGLIRLIKSVIKISLTVELFGAVISFISFSQDYPFWRAVWTSIFHAVSAFNNSGYDVFGGGKNLILYQDDVIINLITAALIITGGIGFVVIRDLLKNKFRFSKLMFHSKVVITMTAILLVSGTLLIKLTDRIPWLNAFLLSTSTRTAGFSTHNLSLFSNAGLYIMMILMFIGASTGGTGGGIKTNTFFVLLQGIKASATNKDSKAFKYSISKETFQKASIVTFLSIFVVFTGIYLISAFDPQLGFRDVSFEVFSAFGTVGLSTGITSSLSVASKLVSILIMFTGRLGPLTIASLWSFGLEERVHYPEGTIAIG